MKNNVLYLNSHVYALLTNKYFLYFNFIRFLKSELQNIIKSATINNYSLECEPRKSTFFLLLLFFFQNHSMLLFKQLLDITAIDTLHHGQRFKLLYQLGSVFYNARFTVILNCSDSDLIPTLTTLYSSAGWFELEIWDLFGVYFYANTRMHRLLTDYGFRYFPLRKDFPLSGYRELFYNTARKRVGYYKISMSQEYRNYFYRTPWL